MKRLQLVVLLTAMVAGTAGAVSQSHAQALTDAQQALQKARTAYDAGRFTEARDLAKKASETDPNNPDIHLLLGKAHYQLGELDEAMAAWHQTLALAPKESFAQKMLEVLQARRKDVDSRIRYIESLVAQRLDAVATVECRTLLETNKALSDAQRAAVLTIQADLAVRAGQPGEARRILANLLALYPKQADPIRTKLIMGQAQLRSGGEATLEGLAILRQLAAGDTPVAATAQWELLSFDLNQGADPARTAALAKWLADHAKHPRADEARQQLLTAYLTLSQQAGAAKPDATLDDHDLAALALADEIIKQTPHAAEKSAVVERLVHHLKARYSSQAHAAAVAGFRKLLAAPLPRPSRAAVQQALFGQLKVMVLETLQSEAKTGKLAAADPAALPQSLAEVVAALEAVGEGDRTFNKWSHLAQLAGEVCALSASIPWPDQVTALRAPDAWAVAIALPVLKADADPQAVKTAAGLVQELVRQYQSLGQPETWRLALDLAGQLVAALSPKSPQWPEALTARIALLDAYARQQFKKNIEAGRGDDNNKLSQAQDDLIATMAKLVASDAGRADFVIERLAEHLRPWIDAQQWPVAETAFAALQKALPPANVRDAELAVVRLSVQRVFRRDRQTVQAGLTVPRELDAVLKQALVRLYSMQAGLEPDSPKLHQVRAVWDTIIGHYRALQYDDIAGLALKTKAPKPVEAADRYAEFQAIRFQEEKARRDLVRRFKEFEGTEKIGLTAELKEVLAAWTKWIGNHPTSPLVAQAVEQVLGIGRTYEQYGAFEVAAGIYGDFAKFAASVKPLAQSSGSQPSVAETASAMVAAALDSRAAKALAKWIAERKPDEPPPAKLSEEYAAAIAAHKAFLAAYPNAVLSGSVVRKITGVAMEYAKIDAWEVAEGVYADLAASDLKLRRPERLEFARGVCQLGRAMPAHAREVLAALYATGPGEAVKPDISATGSAGTLAGILAVRASGETRDIADKKLPLTAADLAKLEKAIDAAYKIFQEVGKKYADTPTAELARGEVMVMVHFWRGLTERERSAALVGRFLEDNPTDAQLPQLRLEAARDRLVWAAKPIDKPLTPKELLAEVAARFAAARAELNKIVADFAKQKDVQQAAQWELANSFLSEARAVSPALAREQFVRAAKELSALAVKSPGHPRMGQIASALRSIALEMENQGYEEEATVAWNELVASNAAFAALSKSLTPDARFEAELAIVRESVEQVLQHDERLLRTGLSVPRRLHPMLKQALVRLYSMQAGLEPSSSKLQQVRTVWDTIIGHYRALQYDDIAGLALKTKAPKAVEAADRYAEFQAIRFQEENARRDLVRRFKEFEGTEKIGLTPELKEVLAAWTKWIGDYPTNPLVSQAVQQVLGIGRTYEQYGAFEVAAGIYGDFAKFAASVKPLAQSSGSQPSVAETASAMVAAALDSRAAKALAKWIAERKPDEPPPAKLSEEYAAAIAAHKAFLAAYPNAALSGSVLRKITGVAMEYAKIDAWEVAEGVYADLAASDLKLRRPERLEFARGVCQLGRAMPAHAREILAALNAAGPGEEPKPPAPVTAVASAAPRGEGGRGGGEGPSGHAWADRPGPGGANDLFADKKPAASGAPTDQALHDSQLLAMIQQREYSRSARVARIHEDARYVANPPRSQAVVHVSAPLTAAELARLEKAIDAAYKLFQDVRKKYADTPTAEQARGEILVMIGFWRGLSEWERSAALAVRFLAENPRDPQLPQLRLEVARDRLAWAAKPTGKSLTRQELLAEVAARFAAARAELSKIVADFARQRALQQEAQWELANSFLTEARAVSAVSPTLARGQFVRAARELRAVAVKYPGHPRLAQVPLMLWNIAQEMESQGYQDEAVLVWNELAISDPLNPLAQQAIEKIAQTYYRDLKRPLKAAETYLELNFIRGGNDTATQQAVFQIGTSLKTEKRWVEALHVLGTFVDSFPRHAQAGQALTMIGQVHQANQAWDDAISAYRRVIDQYKDGSWVQEAKWAIAECRINLSQWREAMAAYRDFASAYPKDMKVAEANRRLDILKDLARFQELVNEKGQRKAFDAQFQIATIVRTQLANPVKGIIEYRKVVTNWPESYVAASALHEIGNSYLALGETAKAREAYMAVAKDYANSPLAGASLFQVGKSYEEEADKLATVTRERTMELARDLAQRKAYDQVQFFRKQDEVSRSARIRELKSAGKGKLADLEEAAGAFGQQSYNLANADVFARQAQAEVETLSAAQLADRQDKINAALRKAIDAYRTVAQLPGGNKADAALLQMANIYDQRLKDSKAAMETWLEIVRQFTGTYVAQDASWKLAQYYDREGKYKEAIAAYNSFFRNYRGSPNAGQAQFAVAECHEHRGEWVAAMDSYNNYINNFPDGPLVAKAKEQIAWIKTYRM